MTVKPWSKRDQQDLKEQYKALRATVSRWGTKRNQLRTGNWEKIQLGPKACPLCMMNNRNIDLEEDRCRYCPIKRYTKERGCMGTPYKEVLGAMREVKAIAQDVPITPDHLIHLSRAINKERKMLYMVKDWWEEIYSIPTYSTVNNRKVRT